MNELISYFKIRKNLVNLLFLVLLVISLPLGIYLVRQQQILRSRAEEAPIAFLEGRCVKIQKDKPVAVCPDITFQLVSPLGPPFTNATSSATPSSTPTPSPQATASATPKPTKSPKPTKTPKPSKTSRLDNDLGFLRVKSVNAEDSEDHQGGSEEEKKTNKDSSIKDKKKSKNGDNPNTGGTGEKDGRRTGITTKVRFGEKADFSDATELGYTQEPLVINYTLKDKTIGEKIIFVEFVGKDKEGRDSSNKQSAKISYVGDAPIVDVVDCLPDPGGKGTSVKIKGRGFGGEPGPGEVKAKKKKVKHKKDKEEKALGATWSITGKGSEIIEDLEELETSITSWDDDEITALVKPSGQFSESEEEEEGLRLEIERKPDGGRTEGSCGPSQLSLGVKLFCRTESGQEQQGVKITILEAGPGKSPIFENVTIDANGLVRGLKTQLKGGQTYQVAIQAPGSLKRLSQPFVYSGGTHQLALRSRDNYLDNIYYNVLPVGDIFPPPLGDGSINSFDRQTLRQQWGQATISATPRQADFNLDQIVNSVDWACMRYDFGKVNDPDPTSVKPINPSPSPSPTDQVVCTQDIKQCPDGSWVGRVPPTCEFTQCPTSANKCGIESCHGLDISCGSNVPDVCTEEYRLGDKCRKFVSCQTTNNSCQKIVDSRFEECKSCVEKCDEKYKDNKDPAKVFECEVKCGE